MKAAAKGDEVSTARIEATEAAIKRYEKKVPAAPAPAPAPEASAPEAPAPEAPADKK